jgi:magnesium and cobalt transporter
MSQDSETDTPAKNWLTKLAHTLSGEPKNQAELLDVVREAEQRQVVDTEALNMIEGVIQVADMQAKEIMVPRPQMECIEHNISPKALLALVAASKHSRFPVLGDNPDEIIGILLAKDLLPLALAQDKTDFSIKDVLRKVTFIPESKRLNVLLKDFRVNRNHMAIVVDEYGGIAGLVTIEDVLEEIVGEIEDEHDVNEEQYFIKEQPAGNYLVKAITPIEAFNAYFNTELEDEEFETIGGIVLKNFGRLPERNQSIEIANLKFKVLNADRRRIRMLQVSTV